MKHIFSIIATGLRNKLKSACVTEHHFFQPAAPPADSTAYLLQESLGSFFPPPCHIVFIFIPISWEGNDLLEPQTPPLHLIRCHII